MKYTFKGEFPAASPALAFNEYLESRLEHYKMDIWQLGVDDLTSEWNSMRPPQSCNCRGRLDIDPREEIENWPFLHSYICLNWKYQCQRKIEEFATPLLDYVEKEGHFFWQKKEATWARIEQKAKETNLNSEDYELSVRKDWIMENTNEKDLKDEEKEQITYLKNLQQQTRERENLQQQTRERENLQQQTRERETKRQKNRTEQQQKTEEFLKK